MFYVLPHPLTRDDKLQARGPHVTHRPRKKGPNLDVNNNEVWFLWPFYLVFYEVAVVAVAHSSFEMETPPPR